MVASPFFAAARKRLPALAVVCLAVFILDCRGQRPPQVAGQGQAATPAAHETVEAADTAARARRDPARPRPVIAIGLDGLDWEILDRLGARGLLPNWRRLTDSGYAANLESFAPMISPVVWTTVATGVGPVALAVAAAVPAARVFGADLFQRPVALARRNAERLGLTNARFVRGDLFAPLPASLRGGVDVVTIHPPYIGRTEMKSLPHEIVGFEPRESLTDDSPEGMGLVSRVAGEACMWLRSGGWLLVEVSPDRSRAVSAALRRAGLLDVRSTKGGVSVSRVIVGRA